jgi:hypothetical protein
VPQDNQLVASFTLINDKGKPVGTDGSASLGIYNAAGILLASQQFSFSRDSFSHSSGRLSLSIPRQKLNFGQCVSSTKSIAVTTLENKVTLRQGFASLTVTTTKGNTFTAVCRNVELYSADEVERAIRMIYFQEGVASLEREINKQWPFKVEVNDYAMVGDWGWAVIGRTGGEIIFYSYSKVYDWYLIHTVDGGHSWDISWGGDYTPLFEVQFLNEVNARVTTPQKVFHTTDGGKTWIL